MMNDIAYLVDIFPAINEVNKILQLEIITLVRCKSVITSFIARVFFYKQNLLRNILLHGSFRISVKMLLLKKKG